MRIIPDGYRKTEIGILPSEWPVVAISEMASTGGGTTPPRSLQSRYFTGGTHLWVKTTDLNNSFVVDTEDKVTELALQETGLKKHPSGTVLVAMYGGFNQIGRTGVLSESSAINQALIAVLPNKNKFHSMYLLANLNYKVEYWKQVASSSRKDPNITSSDVKAFRLPLPSIEEQTAIANALSDVDALISSLEQLIAKKQAIKTATMQQLFSGRTRLPKFTTHPDGRPKGTKQTEFGVIPEDWELTTIGDHTFWLSGGTPRRNKPEYWNGSIPWISGSTLKSFEIFTSDQFLSNEAVSAGSKMAPLGAVLLLVRGSALHNEIRSGLTTALVAFNQDVKALVPDGRLSAQYLAFYFLAMKSEMLKLVSSAGNSAGVLDTELVKGFRLVLPSIEEQADIATALCDMDKDIRTIEQRLTKTRQIKQGMMQELLTGRTRLL